MHRRGFIGACTAGAACLPLAGAMPVFASDARPLEHARALLTDPAGRPLKASRLEPLTNYVFHYPFAATPVFLLNLGKAVPPQSVTLRPQGGTRAGADYYAWPGGVGPQRSIVAFSAICSHKLVYPTRDVSFISFRKSRARRGVQNQLIHCCADHSQYDPAHGATVLTGPAPQPLAAVLIAHDPQADTLTAYATLGAELFDAFFQKYDAKLNLEMGSKAHDPVADTTAVYTLADFSRNNVEC